MALKLKKALQAYDRLDVATVDCGNGWLYRIKSFSSVAKHFAREQARVRAAGGMKKSYVATASVDMSGVHKTVEVDDSPWLLGSFEADIEFFLDNMSVGWTGLLDDDGAELPYSKEIAQQVFLENGEAAQQLYRELLSASLDPKLFLKTANAQAEEDGGN